MELSASIAIDVVVRCRNEMPFAARTLASLAAQRGVHARVLFIDCGSTDGSREAAASASARIIDLAKDAYIPGACLNLGMRETQSEVVAFVNADAVPLDEDALARLVKPLAAARSIAATYARQLPRFGADPLVAAEYARAFPPRAALPIRRGQFFSMAASAIRRDLWRMLPFDESLRYSEDIDWTVRAAALGFSVAYVPDARFEHSHDYTVRQQFHRRKGEGAAERRIFRLPPPAIFSDMLRPLAGALLRDARTGMSSARAVTLRAAQATGYFAGRSRSRGSSK